MENHLSLRKKNKCPDNFQPYHKQWYAMHILFTICPDSSSVSETQSGLLSDPGLKEA